MQKKNLKSWIYVLFAAICIVISGVCFTACTKRNTMDTKQLYAECIQKTVEIRCTMDGTKYGYATGCVLSKDGNILTNRHVVMHNSELFKSIEVRFYNEYTYHSAKVLKVSSTDDLALIKIEDIKPNKIFTIGNSVVGGESVYTIGNPHGFGLSFVEGKVSSPVRYVGYNGYHIKTIQTSLVINEGNSGGGLFNDRGELIGIMSFRLRVSSGEVLQGIAFAIHFTSIQTFLAS